MFARLFFNPESGLEKGRGPRKMKKSIVNCQGDVLYKWRNGDGILFSLQVAPTAMITTVLFLKPDLIDFQMNSRLLDVLNRLLENR